MDNRDLIENQETEKIYDENYLVAFLDILGFKDAIDKCIEEQNLKLLNDIDSSLKRAEKIISLDIQTAEETGYDSNMAYKQFSDSMSISFKHDPTGYIEENNLFDFRLAISLLSLMNVQIEMLKSKIYIRGGLSLGSLHKENNQRIFSEGLINSYFLESSLAKYPRIIIHENLYEILKIMINDKPKASNFGVNKLLLCDWDGTIFINPFKRFEVREKYLNKKNIRKKFKEQHGFELTKEHFKQMRIKEMRTNERILSNVQNKIHEIRAEEKFDPHVEKKYMWLKELIKWNQNETSSQIKFKYVRYRDLNKKE